MRIGVFTKPEFLEAESGDTRYLVERLPDRFDVSVYFEEDVRLCAGDDVVFSRFGIPMRRPFLRRLATVDGPLMINDPTARLRFGTKRNLLEFPDLTARTIVPGSADEVRAFAREEGRVVLKPLERHAGEGVIRLDPGRTERPDWDRFYADYVKTYGGAVAQAYLEEVVEVGDKRINVFGYEAVNAILTIPAEGSFLGHRLFGGTEVPATIEKRDEELLARVIPFLREHGIWWAGLDVIGSKLSELNIVSPSMVWRADIVNGDTRGLEGIIAKLETFGAARVA
ncbi:MAG: hypothetical protein R3266_00710 [Gemmatimonadota bacterium]|nr:hypothetical protein [Gemmatimonadota bacterium]